MPPAIQKILRYSCVGIWPQILPYNSILEVGKYCRKWVNIYDIIPNKQKKATAAVKIGYMSFVEKTLIICGSESNQLKLFMFLTICGSKSNYNSTLIP